MPKEMAGRGILLKPTPTAIATAILATSRTTTTKKKVRVILLPYTRSVTLPRKWTMPLRDLVALHPTVAWCDKDPKEVRASSSESVAKDGWDLTKPQANERRRVLVLTGRCGSRASRTM